MGLIIHPSCSQRPECRKTVNQFFLLIGITILLPRCLEIVEKHFLWQIFKNLYPILLSIHQWIIIYMNYSRKLSLLFQTFVKIACFRIPIFQVSLIIFERLNKQIRVSHQLVDCPTTVRFINLKIEHRSLHRPTPCLTPFLPGASKHDVLNLVLLSLYWHKYTYRYMEINYSAKHTSMDNPRCVPVVNVERFCNIYIRTHTGCFANSDPVAIARHLT